MKKSILILSLLFLVLLLATNLEIPASYLGKDLDFLPDIFYENSASLNLLQKYNKVKLPSSKWKDHFKTKALKDLNNFKNYHTLDNEILDEVFFNTKIYNTKSGQAWTQPYETSKQFISNYNNQDYLKVLLTDKSIFIQGQTSLASKYSIVLTDINGSVYRPSYLNSIAITSGKFANRLNFKNIKNIKNISLTLKIPISKSYRLQEYSLDLNMGNLEATNFYSKNKNLIYNQLDLDPKRFLKINLANEKDKDFFKELALDITDKAKNDYEKTFMVHNWVAENISYDYQSLKDDAFIDIPSDPKSVYEAKKTICGGYSNLTAALLRSLNIPTAIVYGKIFETDSKGKILEDFPSIGHAWNMAWVNNRWVILDTTWDNRTINTGGVLTKGPRTNYYFDPSLQFFSKTHSFDFYVE